MRQDFSSLLKSKDLKVTEPRLAILRTFGNHCDPINAEDVFKKVSKEGVNEVTVYRTLAQFEEKGIIRRVELRKSSVYYELASDHHHHHIICTDCGKIEDFELCHVDAITNKVLSHSSKFSIIKEHSLELFGVCKTCTKK